MGGSTIRWGTVGLAKGQTSHGLISAPEVRTAPHVPRPGGCVRGWPVPAGAQGRGRAGSTGRPMCRGKGGVVTPALPVPVCSPDARGDVQPDPGVLPRVSGPCHALHPLGAPVSPLLPGARAATGPSLQSLHCGRQASSRVGAAGEIQLRSEATVWGDGPGLAGGEGHGHASQGVSTPAEPRRAHTALHVLGWAAGWREAAVTSHRQRRQAASV